MGENLVYIVAAIFILAAVGMFLYQFLAWLEARAVFWQVPPQD